MSNTPAATPSSEMMDMKDAMSLLRAKAPATSSSEPKEAPVRKPYVNKKSPTYIQDYYQFGKHVRDHIKYMKTMYEKGEKTDLEERSLEGLSFTIKRVANFLGLRPFKHVRFVEFPFTDLHKKIFHDAPETDKINDELIDYWMRMEINYKILFNTLISIFTYRMNLKTDVRIGKKVEDYFFVNAVIQFAFQIHAEEFPTNLEFYQVAAALAVLSNEDKNFSIENVNTQLEKEESPIRFIAGNRNLEFFKDRCYGREREE
jgi:hypothetical protein